MKVLSLFAGIGGIDLGLARAGMTTIRFVENHPPARHWLSVNFPGVPIHGNIKTFDGTQFIEADLVAGGFPCQPFSVAGKQKGQDDPRHLWPEMARVIQEVRPRWVLAENVPGLRIIAADQVLEDLEKLGYTSWPLVVGADDIGAPHRRKRVWIVGRKQLADPNGKRERDANEPGRIERESWAGTSDASWGGEDVARWPARPGEPQHVWEAPRLAYTTSTRRETIGSRYEVNAGRQPEPGRSSSGRKVTDPREFESRMGYATDGLTGRVAGLSSTHRREALKALGNSVVPQVVEMIGRAILYTEFKLHLPLVSPKISGK